MNWSHLNVSQMLLPSGEAVHGSGPGFAAHFKEEGAFSWGNASPWVVSLGTLRGSKPPELTRPPPVSRVPWGVTVSMKPRRDPAVLDVACCVWVVSCTWAKRQRKSRCGVMGFAEGAPRGEAVRHRSLMAPPLCTQVARWRPGDPRPTLRRCAASSSEAGYFTFAAHFQLDCRWDSRGEGHISRHKAAPAPPSPRSRKREGLPGQSPECSSCCAVGSVDLGQAEPFLGARL